MATTFVAEQRDIVRSMGEVRTVMIAGVSAKEESSLASKALTVDLSIEKRAYGNLLVAVKSTGAYMGFRLLKMMGEVGNAHARTAVGAEEQERALQRLSLTQKALGHILIKHFRVVGWGNEKMAELSANYVATGSNLSRLKLGMLRFILSIMTVVSLIFALIFIFALWSAAMDGAATPLLAITKNMGWLHDAIQGIVMSMSGEGEGNIFDVLGGSLLALAFVARLVNLPLALITASLLWMSGVFHLLQKHTNDFMAALLAGASLGPFIAMLTKVPILGTAIMSMFNGFIALLPDLWGIFRTGTVLTTKVVLKAFGLIGAGFAMMWYGATRKAGGFLNELLSMFIIAIGGVLVYMGLLALGIGAVVAAPIAAVLAVLFVLYRYRDKVKEIVYDILGLIKKVLFFWNWGSGGDTTVDATMSRNYSDIYSGVPTGNTMDRGYGSRAFGGPVSRGRPYLVGERGPEMFIPGSSGTITANDKMGGTVNHINVKLDVSGVTDRSDKRALAREISDMLNQEMRRIGGQPTRGRF